MSKFLEFLSGQYDYIYFFYGLSFLFLALVCFNIDSKKARSLPWFLLGLFGLAHGVNEWIDLLVITYGQNKVFYLLHPFFLGLSYILLFEFALAGYARSQKEILARRWVYIPLILMILLGARSGENGLGAGIRFFLGFPAASLAAFVVYKAAKSEQKQRTSLYLLSAFLGLYSVFTGLIVPKANFLSAGWINFDSFYQTVKVPVQFIRGFLALSLAMAVWFYSSVLADITYKPQINRLNLKLTKWGVIFTIVTLISLGWVFTNLLDYYASIQIIKNSKEKANSPLNSLIKELSTLERGAISLSRAQAIRNAVFSGKEIDKAGHLLDSFRGRFNARSCFLIDTRGKIIASSGETFPGKNTGEPIFPQSYFKGALLGNTGFSLSAGSKYSERVYYVSYPVKDPKGAISGVVLLTKIIPVKPVLQYRFFSIIITLFVCILTITFFMVLRRRESLIDFIEQANTKLQEIDQLKTDFISIVSHELRTPLTAIKNAAAILAKNKFNRAEADPREKELVEIIIKNTERQARMVGDLLDLSKIEAGVMPVLIERADIVALIKEAAAAFHSQAAGKNISLDLSSSSREIIAFVDPEHTRRIAANLLTNAVKFTPEGGRIAIAIKDELWEVVVSVSDTGPGISQEERKKLFTKFYRAADAKNRERGGTGLGLMITKGLVEAQGGRVWLESEIGRGSIFYFTLVKIEKTEEKARGS